MIKLVVFDVGGTLLDYHTPLNKCDKKILEEMFHIKTSEREIKKAIDRLDLKCGSTHLPSKSYKIQITKCILKRFGIPASKAKEFLEKWDKSIDLKDLKLYSDSLPTIKKLKVKYLIATLANTSDKIFHKKVLKKTKLKEHFHLHIDSDSAGIRKPDEKIFKIVLKHFKVKPSEAVMIGDTPSADILGAKKLGMHTVLINRRRLPYHFTKMTRPDFEIISLKGLMPVLNKLKF
jgi:putative hydrolase of the HAD superfamily